MPNPASGETEIAPEAELSVGQGESLCSRSGLSIERGGVLRPRVVCFPVVLGVPSGGWKAACVHSGESVIMLLRLDATFVLLPLCSCAG